MYLHHDSAAAIVDHRMAVRRAAADRHRLTRRTRRTRHAARIAPGGIEALTDRVAADGPAPVEAELASYARFARRWGANPALVDVMADPGQPAVARQRAFGRIAAELANATTSTCGDGDRVAA
jgi:hypothetical protein